MLQELSNSVLGDDEDCTSFMAVVAGHRVGIRDEGTDSLLLKILVTYKDCPSI